MNDREEVVRCSQVIRLSNFLFLSLHLTHTQAPSERSAVSLRWPVSQERKYETLWGICWRPLASSSSCARTRSARLRHAEPPPPFSTCCWLIKDEFRGEVWPSLHGKQEKGWKKEWKMKGRGQGPLWSPQDHTVNGLFTQRGMEGRRTRSQRKKENSHILQCLMPVARLCNYSPLSLAPSSSFIPPLTPVPLFAFFLLICANHHETTATLEPLTGPAWHPELSTHIRDMPVLCACCSSSGSFHSHCCGWWLIWPEMEKVTCCTPEGCRCHTVLTHTCVSHRHPTSSTHRHKKRAPTPMWSFYDLLARQRGCRSLPPEASAGCHRPHLRTSLRRARARLFVVSASFNSIFLPF